MSRGLVVVGCAATVLLVGVLAASTTWGFLRLEEKEVRAGAERVRAVLERRGAALASMAADRAGDSGVLAFSAGAAGPSRPLGMDGAYLAELGVESALLSAADGRRIELRAPGAHGPALSESAAALVPSGGRPVSGFASLKGSPYLLASCPVGVPGQAGSGGIVLAQALDPVFAKEVSWLSGAAVSFSAPDARQGKDPGVRIERTGLKGSAAGVFALKDAAGTPVALVRAAQNRDTFAQGLRSAALGVVLAALLLAAAAFSAYALISALIVQPLASLEESFEAGSGRAELDGRLAVLGARLDLVGRTARVIAKAQDRAERAMDAQLSAKLELEREVRLRTEALSEANRELSLYKSIVDGTAEGIVITDADGNITEVNSAFCRMTGYSERELLGANPRILKSDRHDREFFKKLNAGVAKQGHWEGEIWNLRKDGTIYPQLMTINSISDGERDVKVGICVDISRLKSVEESLNRMAFVDELTGLPNRALFNDRFGQALSRAKRTRTRLALLYLDLDRFKHVNDSLGHHAGDEVLRGAALRLRGQVRDSDTVCRLGGDEFTVILENLGSTEDAASVGRKIVSALQEPFVFGDVEALVGASVGIAVYPFDGTTEEDLVKRADAAMYEAKEHGRGQIRLATGQSGAASTTRIETESKLRRAIDKGELFVLYQPQVAAGGAALGSSAGIIGAEALVRWRMPNGKIIPPDAFIQIAEDTGLVVPLGSVVLKEACREAMVWNREGTPVQVSVNVSQLQFEQGRIIDQLAEALEESRLPPELLKLEITESLFSRDMDRMISVMKEIKSLGVRFAVDDFGTGYSSLRYIDKLPIDTLKIDKSFIQSIDSRYEGGEIATAVVSLARSFGLESIAEGVETEGQLDALRSRGCDAIQGYYVSKPIDAEAFRSFISSRDVLPELVSPD